MFLQVYEEKPQPGVVAAGIEMAARRLVR